MTSTAAATGATSSAAAGKRGHGNDPLEITTTFSSLSDNTPNPTSTSATTPKRAYGHGAAYSHAYTPVSTATGSTHASRIKKKNFLAKAAATYKGSVITGTSPSHTHTTSTSTSKKKMKKPDQSSKSTHSSKSTTSTHTTGQSAQSGHTGLSKGDFYSAFCHRLKGEPAPLSPKRQQQENNYNSHTPTSKQQRTMPSQRTNFLQEYNDHDDDDDMGEEKKQDQTPTSTTYSNITAQVNVSVGAAPIHPTTSPETQNAWDQASKRTTSWIDSMEPGKRHPKQAGLQMPSDSDDTSLFVEESLKMPPLKPAPTNLQQPQQQNQKLQTMVLPIPPPTLRNKPPSAADSSSGLASINSISQISLGSSIILATPLPMEQFQPPTQKQQASSHMQGYRDKLQIFFDDNNNNQQPHPSVDPNSVVFRAAYAAAALEGNPPQLEQNNNSSQKSLSSQSQQKKTLPQKKTSNRSLNSSSNNNSSNRSLKQQQRATLQQKINSARSINSCNSSKGSSSNKENNQNRDRELPLAVPSGSSNREEQYRRIQQNQNLGKTPSNSKLPPPKRMPSSDDDSYDPDLVEATFTSQNDNVEFTTRYQKLQNQVELAAEAAKRNKQRNHDSDSEDSYDPTAIEQSMRNSAKGKDMITSPSIAQMNCSMNESSQRRQLDRSAPSTREQFLQQQVQKAAMVAKSKTIAEGDGDNSDSDDSYDPDQVEASLHSSMNNDGSSRSNLSLSNNNNKKNLAKANNVPPPPKPTAVNPYATSDDDSVDSYDPSKPQQQQSQSIVRPSYDEENPRPPQSSNTQQHANHNVAKGGDDQDNEQSKCCQYLLMALLLIGTLCVAGGLYLFFGPGFGSDSSGTDENAVNTPVTPAPVFTYIPKPKEEPTSAPTVTYEPTFGPSPLPVFTGSPTVPPPVASPGDSVAVPATPNPTVAATTKAPTLMPSTPQPSSDAPSTLPPSTMAPSTLQPSTGVPTSLAPSTTGPSSGPSAQPSVITVEETGSPSLRATTSAPLLTTLAPTEPSDGLAAGVVSTGRPSAQPIATASPTIETSPPTAGVPVTESPTSMEPTSLPPTSLEPTPPVPSTASPTVTTSNAVVIPFTPFPTTREPTTQVPASSAPTTQEVVMIPFTPFPTTREPTTPKPSVPTTLGPTREPTTKSPSSEQIVVLSELPDETWQHIAENPASAQARAFRWVVEDPNLDKYPQWQQVQRFSLVTTYYSWFDPVVTSLEQNVEASEADNGPGPVVNRPGGNEFSNNFIRPFGDLEAIVVEGQQVSRSGEVYMNKLKERTQGLDPFSRRHLQQEFASWLDYDYPECQWYYLRGNYSSETFWLAPLTSQPNPKVPFKACSDDGAYESLQVPKSRDPSPGTVVDIFVDALPPEICLLTDLTSIRMPSNKVPTTLEEFIPQNMTQLTKLRELDFSQSNIQEWSPQAIVRLPTSIEVLDLSFNSMQGELFLELGLLMTSLRELYLMGNQLRGTIPVAIPTWTRLKYFYMSGNELSGSLPSEMGWLSSHLEVLSLSANKMQGTLPTEIGTLELLTSLDLDKNRFIGFVHSEIGRLTNLEYLGLADNNLQGPIPTQLGLVSGLQQLRLSNNLVTGSVPSEIALLRNLTNLQAFGNALIGTVPTELGTLSDNLYSIDLHDNALMGPVPSELGLLTSVNFLYLYENMLSGSLPTELGLLSNVSYVGFESNRLDGSIPSEFGLMKELRYVHLAENDLTSRLPTELGTLSRLKYLFLGQNEFTGEIPSELGLLTNLRFLDVGGRSSGITGSVPAELCALTDITIRIRCAQVECDCDCECA
ncbi:LRR receptor-like serine threonine-protein kinase [Seminavis robusta]|uniref:LRR receptor-like serine threonine-protein kinase n=1 Tax=Seminavis robusta TaxID=568900 RepID=A0A9N8E4Y5_9STRA|nr:LRR receptor-like serine threonine-protein kinase [Seminavis robusta]|eukprot:Sro554_g165520.1 LRR receptor-like serine threonine-protein kinase (1791) ;mRNA; r:29017-34593